VFYQLLTKTSVPHLLDPRPAGWLLLTKIEASILKLSMRGLSASWRVAAVQYCSGGRRSDVAIRSWRSLHSARRDAEGASARRIAIAPIGALPNSRVSLIPFATPASDQCARLVVLGGRQPPRPQSRAGYLRPKEPPGSLVLCQTVGPQSTY
jgi:hypothetical protein